MKAHVSAHIAIAIFATLTSLTASLHLLWGAMLPLILLGICYIFL